MGVAARLPLRFVSKLIDEIEGDGLRVRLNRQKRHAVSCAAAGFCGAESLAGQVGQNLTDGFAVFGGELFCGRENVIVDGQRGAHKVFGLTTGRSAHQTSHIKHHTPLTMVKWKDCPGERRKRYWRADFGAETRHAGFLG